MSDHVAVAIHSHYLALIIHVQRNGLAGTGKTKCTEESIVIEKSVRLTVRKRFCHIIIEIEPHNLANIIDGVGNGEGSFGERDIDCQEQASIPKKP